MKKQIPLVLYIAWAVSFLASCASIYFIEISGNPVATFCWINRMLMFSLFLLFSVALITKPDYKQLKNYTIPFLGIGLILALYQQLVRWNVIEVTKKACSESYICSVDYFTLFGFINQVTLCLAAFAIIGLCIFLIDKRK